MWTPLPSRISREKQVGIACREKLGLLKDATYLCEDEEVLKGLLQQLDASLTYMRGKVLTQDGLPLHTELPQHKHNRGNLTGTISEKYR